MMPHPAMGGSKGKDIRNRALDDVERALVKALRAFTRRPFPTDEIARGGLSPEVWIDTHVDDNQRLDNAARAAIASYFALWQAHHEGRHADVFRSKRIGALRRAYQAELVLALEALGYAPTRTDALWTARTLLHHYGRDVTTRTLENVIRRQKHRPGRPGDVLPITNDWPLSTMAQTFGIEPEWRALLHVCSGRARIPLRPLPRPSGPAGHTRKRRVSET
jgi:hypothetical protein